MKYPAAITNFVIESNAIEGYILGDYDIEHPLFSQHLETLSEALRLADCGGLIHPHKVHSGLMSGLLDASLVGRMRPCQVYVGPHTPPPPIVAERMLEEWWNVAHVWCAESNRDVQLAWELHLIFEYIHPYVDGNGRTGRVLWAAMQALAVDEVVPVYLLNRQQYYAELRDYEQGKTAAQVLYRLQEIFGTKV